MSTGVRRRGGGSGGRNETRQLQSGWKDELDAFSKELERRPEVTVINKYVVVLVYIRIGLKGMGAMALLWCTVVLLGGFVSDLSKKDFSFLIVLALVQAAGLLDAMGNARFVFLGDWLNSLLLNIASCKEKHHGRTQFFLVRWLKIITEKAIDIILVIIFLPVMYFAIAGPILCVTLSAFRIAKQDYGIGAVSKANLKPALNLYYYVSLVHGTICLLCSMIEMAGDYTCVGTVNQQNGFSHKILHGYLDKTKQMCTDDPASTVSWNLITYGAVLLDSQLPEDYATGGRVLTMLIDQDIPLQVRRLMIRSPRPRIQKLIRTLAWRSPAEQEMRWLAARILEHLACDIKLVHFPGALQCISSLFDTCHSSADREALHSPFVTELSKPPENNDGPLKILDMVISKNVHMCVEWIRRTCYALYNCGTLEQHSNQRDKGNEEIDEGIVLPGLRILENLAHDGHNCTLIYNTKDLLSKIVAPVRFRELQEDIKSNSTAWTKVVDGSLKVVSRLMCSSGKTGIKMCRSIANDRTAVTNLKVVLDMDTAERNRSVMELQMRAIEVLTQLALGHPTILASYNPPIFATGIISEIIKRALHIFLTTDWMRDYLKVVKRRIETPTASHVKKKIKKAKETASRLKEKAGEALAMLSSDSEAVKSFTIEICTEDYVRRLTDLLDSNIKTIECIISDTDDPVQIEINICCRISAAVILKNLRDRDMKLAVEKALTELIPIPAIQAEPSSTQRWWEPNFCCCTAANSCIRSIRHDIEEQHIQSVMRNNTENRSDGGQDEHSASLSHHIQQCGERRLQAELISLVAVNLENNNFDFAAILILPPRASPVSLLEEFVVKLKKMVDDNMYATPACLAIQKLACKTVTGLLQHDGNVELINNKNIIGTLLKASKVMARFECSMIFSGVDRDCHGIALKPLSSVLAKQAEDLLKLKKQAQARARAQVRRTNSAPASVSPT